MRIREAMATAAAAAAIGVPLMAQTIAPPAEVVIHAVAIVDVERGRLVPGQDLVIRGTRVERIAATGGPLPGAKTRVEGRGKFVVPGYLEAPVDLAAFQPATLQRLLAAGITTVLDAAPEPARLDRWRRDLDTGRLYAPRLARGCATGSPDRPTPTSPRDSDAIHDTLARLVAAGRTPAQALRSVTGDRARIICAEGFGVVAAGAPADLVVLTANPLDDIRHSRAIDAVVFRGEVLTQAHLNLLARGSLPAPTPSR